MSEFSQIIFENLKKEEVEKRKSQSDVVMEKPSDKGGFKKKVATVFRGTGAGIGGAIGGVSGAGVGLSKHVSCQSPSGQNHIASNARTLPLPSDGAICWQHVVSRLCVNSG